MVQHNNVQPRSSSSSSIPGVGISGHSTGGSNKSSRLLPYPPIVGEAELFHPRPRMGVGVGGLAGELENGLEDGLERNAEGEADETTYHSALEIQTGIDDSEDGGGGEGSPAATSEEPSGFGNDIETRVESDATDGVGLSENAKEEEGPSTQDLLFTQSQTQPRVVPSKEAWETELGKTVKRISSNGISAAAATTGGSISSIGSTKTRMRPRKRELVGENEKMSEVDGLSKKMTGVLDSEIFEAPNSVASCAEGDTVDDKASAPLPGSAAFATTSSARQSALDERESKIVILESALNVRESSIAERDSLITKRESCIIDQESYITDRESSLDSRESSITSRESTISELESDIAARESALTSNESEIQRRTEDIEQREMEVEKRESEVDKREREVSECELRVEKIVCEVEKREQEVSECETRVKESVCEVEKREQEVSECEARAEKRENEVEKRDQEVSESEARMEKREYEVEKREQEISECEVRMEKRESEAEKREQEVSECETRVERREREVKEWYQRKLSEIDERMLVVDVPPPTITASDTSSSTPAASSYPAKSKWPPSPMEFARRLCATFILPVLGEERTPGILLPGNGTANSSTSSSTTSASTTSITATSPTLPGVPFWSLKRDFFLNRLLGATAGGGSFLVLVGIGICVIFLRGVQVVRKVLRAGPGEFGR